jgi:hypothetical protein
VAVNDRTGILNTAVIEAFDWSPDEQIEWLSPTRADEFAEYYDQAFLDRLGLTRLATPLEEFWPAGGPRWDGLARTASGKVVLVEAKAHIEEMVDFRSKASPDSLARIIHALEMAKAGSGAAADAPWPSPFFQYANRLAHLHFLVELNQVDAYLLFVLFADAPDVPVPATAEQWEGAHRLAWRSLGLGATSFRGRVANMTISVPDVLVAGAGQPGVAAGGSPRRR